MLEVLVRPFETPQSLARTRIAPVVASGDPPGPAILTWGAAGTVPEGAPQPDDLDPYEDVSFTTECCDDKLDQKAGETETVRVYEKTDTNKTGPYFEYRRPIKLDFKKDEQSKCAAGKRPDLVIAPIEGLFTPDGQAVYAVTDNRAKKNCESGFKYEYPKPEPYEEVVAKNELVV